MQVVDVGAQYLGETNAQRINKHGQVVGSTMSPMHPFRWDIVEGFWDLGPVGAYPATGEDINDNGQIVGVIDQKPKQGFVWDPVTGYTSLGRSLSLLNKSSRAWGNNNHNHVVGAAGSQGRKRAFILKERDRLTILEPIPGLGPDSWAWAINDSGQVVGYSGSSKDTGIRHACLWEKGKTIDLGTLGGTQSEAMAINNLGQIVGWSTTWWHPGTHAFLWENGKMHWLPDAPGADSSLALDINDLGHVVGTSPSAAGGPIHACVWEGRVPISLPPMVGTYCAANGINDLGQVVGQAKSATWYEHAVLWSADLAVQRHRGPRRWW